MSEMLHSEEVTHAGITWTWDHYTYYSESNTGYRASVQYVKGVEGCTAWGPTRQRLADVGTRLDAIKACHEHARTAQKSRTRHMTQIKEILTT